MNVFFKKHKIALLLGVLFFLLPFLWLAPGEMDLGGDATRLYFYDPINFMKATATYVAFPEGKGVVEPKYYYIPYVAIITLFTSLFSSGTVVISMLNGLKLGVGFISVYFIAYTLLSSSAPATIAGLFYIVSQNSIHAFFSWDRALFTHDQVFLNPLMFLFLLQFSLTGRYMYMWIALLVSFIFATNFSIAATPAVFAFYPISVLFIIFYTVKVRRISFPWFGVIAACCIFLGIHAFHLMGSVMSLLDSGSATNTLFTKQEIEAGGVNYFIAVADQGKAILNLFLPSEKPSLVWLSIVAPLLLITSSILTKKKNMVHYLLLGFFLITTFLTTANITNLGFEFYKRLFYIPGFAMFRVFFEKWIFVHIFFYSLLIGSAFYLVQMRLKKRYATLLTMVVCGAFVIIGIPMFNGSPVTDRIIPTSVTKSVLHMDPAYAHTLQFVRTLPPDGKIMILPLTDFFRQVVAGEDGGAYEGPSTLLHLTHMYSFAGYQHFGYKGSMPYAEDLMRYAREADYDRILGILTQLNIRYILHDADPAAYEVGFPILPFVYMRTSLPATQSEYKLLISKLPFQPIYSQGFYTIYEIDPVFYNPTIFSPAGVYLSTRPSLEEKQAHLVFVDKAVCVVQLFHTLCGEEYDQSDVHIQFTQPNPSLYEVGVEDGRKKKEDLFIVMQHAFHHGWKLRIGNQDVAEARHIVVNGYANGWLIPKEALPPSGSFRLSVYLDPQKYFAYGWMITVPSIFITIYLLIISVKKMYET